VAALTDIDLPAWLAGEWSVLRQINDDSQAFIGTAHFTAGADRGLTWRETGRLRLHGFDGEARRSYLLVPAAPAWQVCFDDGRPFHGLDLHDGHCDAVHVCGPDLYRGTYTVPDTDRLTVTWRVTGPGRDDTIATEYRRAASWPQPPPRRAARSCASTRTSA
jgi:hypothetical protein